MEAISKWKPGREDKMAAKAKRLRYRTAKSKNVGVSEDIMPNYFKNILSVPVINTRIIPTGNPSLDCAVFQMDALAFLKSLHDNTIDIIITDPAYSGMNEHLKLGRGRIVGEYGKKGNGGKWFQEFRDTEENYSLFLEQAARVLKPNSHLFLMFDSYSLLTLGPLVRRYFALKNILVWDKVNIGMGHYFRRQTEFIIFACKGKRPLTRRNIGDIIRVKRIHNAAYPTQKPVELFRIMLEASLIDGDSSKVVCDPFVGSGSSAVAAYLQGHSFIGADVSLQAVELAAKRLEIIIKGKQDPLESKVKSVA